MVKCSRNYDFAVEKILLFKIAELSKRYKNEINYQRITESRLLLIIKK